MESQLSPSLDAVVGFFSKLTTTAPLPRIYSEASNLTSLHQAVLEEDLYLVNKLLGDGNDVNAACLLKTLPGLTSERLPGPTPLFLACELGNMEIVNALLAAGANINAIADFPCTFSKMTPLLVAAKNGHEAIALKLLDTPGIHILPITNHLFKYNAKTLLHYAAQHDMLSVLKRGLDAGLAGFLQHNPWSSMEQPLHIAAKAGHFEAFKLLQPFVTSIDLSSRGSQTSLHLAAANGQLQIFNFCLEKKADPQKTCTYTTSTHTHSVNLLHLAVIGGNQEIAAKALELGIKPEAPSRNEWTALHWAIACRNLEMVQYLVQNCKSVLNTQVLPLSKTYGSSKVTPLAMACRHFLPAVPVLLGAKCDVHITSSDLSTPFHFLACASSEVGTETQIHDAVQGLIAAGLDIHAKNKSEETALQLACSQEKCNVPVIKVLLEYSAKAQSFIGRKRDASAASFSMKTSVSLQLQAPVEAFLRNSCTDLSSIRDIFSLFKQHNVDFSACDQDGNSYLHRAVISAGLWDRQLRKRSCYLRKRSPHRASLLLELALAQQEKINQLLQAGLDACIVNEYGETALQAALEAFSEDEEERIDCRKERIYRTLVLLPLVEAGDYSWFHFCNDYSWTGLEKCLFSVWKKAPEELGEMLGLTEPGVKPAIAMALLVLNRNLPGMDISLKMTIISAAF